MERASSALSGRGKDDWEDGAGTSHSSGGTAVLPAASCSWDSTLAFRAMFESMWSWRMPPARMYSRAGAFSLLMCFAHQRLQLCITGSTHPRLRGSRERDLSSCSHLRDHGTAWDLLLSRGWSQSALSFPHQLDESNSPSIKHPGAVPLVLQPQGRCPSIALAVPVFHGNAAGVVLHPGLRSFSSSFPAASNKPGAVGIFAVPLLLFYFCRCTSAT